MKNRYGDEYNFEKIGENLYTITGDLKHWRLLGKENQTKVDYSDLGAIDPSGGPYISSGFKIGNQKVKKISMDKDKDLFLFEVE